MRYTRKELHKSLDRLNRIINFKGSKLWFKAEGRNGYTAIDLWLGDSCISHIASGTPKDCYHATLEYIVFNIK